MNKELHELEKNTQSINKPMTDQKKLKRNTCLVDLMYQTLKDVDAGVGA